MDNVPSGKYLWTAKVGEKGQIVIPKEARSVFNINPGDTLLLLGDIKQGIAIVNYDIYSQFAEEIMKIGKDREQND